MADVVGIRGDIVPQVMPPNDDVIKVLEDLLERAKSGEVLGVCIAFQERDECCGLRRSGLASYRLLGFIHGMAASLTADLAK